MKGLRFGTMFARVEVSTVEELAAIVRERAEAGTLLAALLRLPEEERERSLHLDPRCHTVSLGRLLLAAAPSEPGEREAQARLALAITDLLPRTGKPPALTASLRSSALLFIADALREQNRLVEARAALALVPAELEACGDPLDQAGYCLELGRLRREQGRIDEALALLARAADLYGDLEEQLEEGVALIELGELALLQHETRRAFIAFERALRGGATLYGGDLKMRATLGAALALERSQDDERAPETTQPPLGGRE
jgi:tetratricopeptide (TPR) repeat protein